jgi:anti-anti-sigma regulatory factor
MHLDIMIQGDVVILSNFRRLLDNPSCADTGRDIQELLEPGHQKFILDLGGVGETRSSFLGLLLSISQRIQWRGGEVVMAGLSGQMEEFLARMQMDNFWNVFPSIKDAVQSFRKEPDRPDGHKPE